MALTEARAGWRRSAMPAVVLATGVALSLALGGVARQEIVHSAQQRFDSRAQDMARKVEDRFDAYTEVLIGLRALLSSSDAMSRQQFRQYVVGLRLSDDYPGFQVLNYAPRVTAADKRDFEQRLRTGLAPAVARELRVTPAGERGDYHPLLFIEPLKGNERALGKDLGANPEALTALEEARDSGALTSSGRKIRIKGREADLGLAMRLPVYRVDWPQDSVEARRAAYVGSVGAGFRVADMLRDMGAANVVTRPRLRLFDGGSAQGDVHARVESRFIDAALLPEDKLLFDSAAAPAVTGVAPASEGAAHRDAAQRTLAFQLGGRVWIVHVSEDPAPALGGLDRAMPWLLLFCGLAISGLLAGIVHWLTASRSRAEAIALLMTRDLRASQRQLKLESEVAQLLVNDGEPTEVTSRALEAVCRHLGWDCGSIWGVGEDGIARCSACWHAGDDAAIDRFARMSRSVGRRHDEGSLGRAWASGEALRIATLSAGADLARDALASQAGLKAGLIVPMAAAGSVTALELYSRAPHEADADTAESLRAIALQIAQYMQRKRAETTLHYVASHDALTGLGNRSTLQLDLARAIKRSTRHQKPFAVMFVDLDGFKYINDTLGHGVGDAMIKACGERLATVLREDDTAARFGGDEFVLVLENLTKAGDAAVVAEKVLACCAEPFVIGERELHVTASIGVSIYPQDGPDGEALLKNADTAMYRAKDRGRGSYQFYAAQMNAQSTERMKLETGLRRALERGELELHYQPKMNLRTQGIVGVEALMRWRHPLLGMVPPVQFIPIAEETGLIDAMGRWAIQQACADARTWTEQLLPAVQMSVNLSPHQLNSRTLIADIANALKATGLAPGLLELEITEGAMMANPEHAVGVLRQIREMGVGLAIDDFGTGYSSLSYLKRFPLSTVKIDRSFVNELSTDPDAQALINGIITLAHGLRMKVVAEGVETAEQLSYLRMHDCDEIQGYWLCRPMPAEEACKFMTRHLLKLFASPMGV